jgi:hypothetical protein
MVTNLILLLIATAIFYGYTYGYVYRTVGILKSVSDSVYHVKNPIWFQLTMMLFPIPFIIAGENVSTTWLQEFTCFFGGALICFVGVAACIKKGDDMEEAIHVFGATGGILLGTIYVATFGWVFMVIAILFTLFVMYCHFLPKIQDKINTTSYAEDELSKLEYFIIDLPIVHNHTWVIEVVAVSMILGTVLIQTLINL